MADLKKFLNRVVDDFHQPEFLSSDPLEYVLGYKDPWDQEAVALLAAVLAYGNVKQIRKSIASALAAMSQVSNSPKDFVKTLSKSAGRKTAHRIFQGYVHRFNQGSDLVFLFQLLERSWSRYGSLGNHFVHYLDPKADQITSALISLMKDWHDWLPPEVPSTFSYLLTSPQDGSCCKRWCMFLRWMGRSDSVDPGLWTKNSKLAQTFSQGRYLEARQLIMPLDTHTGRISQYLGLTHRKSLNWKAAVEVTESLKKVDCNDPTRYDFALSRLGILDLCQKSYREEICRKCLLLPVCQFAQKFS